MRLRVISGCGSTVAAYYYFLIHSHCEYDTDNCKGVYDAVESYTSHLWNNVGVYRSNLLRGSVCRWVMKVEESRGGEGG